MWRATDSRLVEAQLTRGWDGSWPSGRRVGSLLTAAVLVEAGGIDAADDADERALAWHAYFWDRWFALWGGALAVPIGAVGHGCPTLGITWSSGLSQNAGSRALPNDAVRYSVHRRPEAAANEQARVGEHTRTVRNLPRRSGVAPTVKVRAGRDNGISSGRRQ
jgi:hypothetical protein